MIDKSIRYMQEGGPVNPFDEQVAELEKTVEDQRNFTYVHRNEDGDVKYTLPIDFGTVDERSWDAGGGSGNTYTGIDVYTGIGEKSGSPTYKTLKRSQYGEVFSALDNYMSNKRKLSDLKVQQANWTAPEPPAPPAQPPAEPEVPPTIVPTPDPVPPPVAPAPPPPPPPVAPPPPPPPIPLPPSVVNPTPPPIVAPPPTTPQPPLPPQDTGLQKRMEEILNPTTPMAPVTTPGGPFVRPTTPMPNPFVRPQQDVISSPFSRNVPLTPGEVLAAARNPFKR